MRMIFRSTTEVAVTASKGGCAGDCTCRPVGGQDQETREIMKKKAIIKVLRNLVDYAWINHCCHENTYRGGVLWEICEECGAKWADDQGGKPADAGKLPEALREAVELLDRLERKS